MSALHPTRAMPGPHDITRVVLDNGLVILVRENHAAPVVVLEGALPAGSIHVPREQAGLANFVASMVMRGSEHYTFDAFNDAIEGVGASLSVSAGDHSTEFGSTSLSEDFPRMLELLADCLRRPTFPAAHMERVRAQKLVGIQERDQDTSQIASLRFHESMYAGHPYANSNLGYMETIPSIERQQLVEFHARRYAPQGTVIVVTGDIESERAIALIREQFSDWSGPSPQQDLPPVDTTMRSERLFYPLADKVQSDIVMGCHAVSRYHEDFHALRVANTILGRFGLMGRLGETVREEQGLAYYAYSTLDALPAGGVWYASAGVNPASVNVAVESILAEFDRLGAEPVPDAELEDSQAFLTGVVPITLETNEGVASTLLNMEWHNLGLDYLQRYNSIVYGITAEDVQRVAATYLRRENCLAVVAGPAVEQNE
jgi:zinc protease